MGSPLRILMATPEFHPWAPGGDLGEATHALALALGERGHHVDVLVPWAPRRAPPVQDLLHLASLSLRVGTQEVTARLLAPPGTGTVRPLLLDAPALYDRLHLYGEGGQDYEDNATRYVALSRATLAVGPALGLVHDVLHAHDWQTGLGPYYAREMRVAGLPVAVRTTVFTFHALAYQGCVPPERLPLMGLGPEHFTPERLEFFGRVSLLKAGLLGADRVVAPSPTHAREVLSAEQGHGLDGVLRARGGALSGILNGLDPRRWDPGTDPALPAHYTLPTTGKKEVCCRALHAALGLPRDERPLFCAVASLEEQRSTATVAAVARDLVAAGGRLLVLGQATPAVRDGLLAAARATGGAVSLRLDGGEGLLRLALAGADYVMVPSRLEPCGLLQLMALRYGTPPLVRRTGGLRDTVADADAQPSTGTGVAYVGEGEVPLMGAVHRALALYNDTPRYRAVQQRAVLVDVSAAPPAARYESLYREALEGASPATTGGPP
jgi:starch synthase